MNKPIILQTAHGSLAGTISFPEAVRALLSAGVEYYQVDYVRQRKTFYSGDGDAISTPIDLSGLPAVSADFDAAALRANILDSQQHGQKFRDFSRRAMQNGVHAYYAFLRGRRVTYLGRTGDQHTEWFPGAKPAASP